MYRIEITYHGECIKYRLIDKFFFFNRDGRLHLAMYRNNGFECTLDLTQVEKFSIESR